MYSDIFKLQPYNFRHKSFRLIATGLILSLISLVFIPGLTASRPFSVSTTEVDFSTLPLSFLTSPGEAGASEYFRVQDMGGTVYFMDSSLTLSLPVPGKSSPAVVHQRFVGANSTAVEGSERLPGVVHYFVGNDPARWRANLPTYAGIIYRQLYPGIDLSYSGTQGKLKGTFQVAPGANPALIQWRYDGAKAVGIHKTDGSLLITPVSTEGPGSSTVVDQAPTAWQMIGGRRVDVTVGYTLRSDGTAGFLLGAYNPKFPLTIDPTLVYSTYLGGGGRDDGEGIALDSEGNIYITGSTSSSNFPTANPMEPNKQGEPDEDDAFIVKINASGDAMIYSTYLGGAQNDQGKDVVVDVDGNATISGTTMSLDFPTQNPLQGSCSLYSSICLGDVFVAKLNSNGSALLYSTYLGGSHIEYTEGMAIDDDGNTYIAGSTASTDFPTQNALQSNHGGGTMDGFVTKLNANGSAMEYSTYLGGSDEDMGLDVAVDQDRNAYITGQTLSHNFPTISPYQNDYAGEGDAFVTKVNPSGSSILYSTYLGGSDEDLGYAISTHNGNAYVTGKTASGNFPTQNPLHPTHGGKLDAFVSKLSSSGDRLEFSTYLGGSEDDWGNDIAVNSSGNPHIAGQTRSSNFPLVDPVQSNYGGKGDAFITKMSADGQALDYSTFLGGSHSDLSDGIVLNDEGSAFITGITYSGDFPIADPLQAENGGGDFDAFIAEIQDDGGSTSQEPAPELDDSYVSASKATVLPGEGITYTILLRNGGDKAVVVDVVDPLPLQVHYLPNTASPGAAYDPVQRMISWHEVSVPSGGEVGLNFQVTVASMDVPTQVTNTVTITTQDQVTYHRSYTIQVDPELSKGGGSLAPFNVYMPFITKPATSVGE